MLQCVLCRPRPCLECFDIVGWASEKKHWGVKLTARRGAGTVHGIRFERTVNDLHNCPADATATPIRMVYLSGAGLHVTQIVQS